MGLVLAGGRSTRMGADKALIKPWGQHGPTLLERAYEMVRKFVPTCLVSCNQELSYDFLPCLADSYQLKSPLNGILTGLQKARSCGFANILALACDLPLMTSPILGDLLCIHYSAGPDTLATLYKSKSTGTVEMLAGIYSCECIPFFMSGMKKGEKSLYQLISDKKCCFIDYGEELESAFLNCNTRCDLANMTGICDMQAPDSGKAHSGA